jgi:hypothetical protein
MRDRRARRLTRAELGTMGLTPGLMARRYPPDGRARLEQLAPEGRVRRQKFPAGTPMTRRLSRRLRELDDRADRELEKLITKRHDPRDGDALLVPSYAESVRRYNTRREEENRSEWGNFHLKMSRLHAWLSEEHAHKAQSLKGE